MADQVKSLEQIVLTRLMRLNATVQGVAAGVLLGLIIFLATNWLLIKGGPIGPEQQPIIGPHLALLGQFFIGYNVSFLGSLIGFAYGFGSGFLVGYFVARMFYWMVDLLESKPAQHA
jgi:hypothetical protein